MPKLNRKLVDWIEAQPQETRDYMLSHLVSHFLEGKRFDRAVDWLLDDLYPLVKIEHCGIESFVVEFKAVYVAVSRVERKKLQHRLISMLSDYSESSLPQEHRVRLCYLNDEINDNLQFV